METYKGWLLVLLIFSSTSSVAQKDSTKLAYVTPSIGAYLINDPGFKDVYGTNLLAKASLSLAVPITRSFFLKGIIGHMRKKGVPIFYTYDSDFNVVDSTQEGSAKISINILQLAGQFKIPLSGRFEIRLEGGLAMAAGKENTFRKDGSKSVSSEFAGLLGPYGGISANYRARKHMFFISTSYIKSRSDVVGIFENYGGLEIQCGVMLFF